MLRAPLASVVAICLLLVPLLGCRTVPARPESTELPAESSGPEMDFIIGPGDVLEVSVWEDERLTKEVTVRPDGRISLPLVGELKAAGLSPLDLQEVLVERYGAYAIQPHVSVIVKEIRSYVVYIQGEVKSPGAYPLWTPTTLIQLISQAGGFTEWAKPSRIKVLRFTGQKQEVLEVDYNAVVEGKDPRWLRPLRPGDTIIVP
jgi:polysaccharide export outer membrane protein